jgi:glycosyltransferase involved in cell wall biosynthesis
MVLYFFPPIGGTSMSRNVRNVQHLPAHGWEPVVLTPRDGSFHLRDRDALALIPARTRVIRTGSIEAGHVRPIVVGILGALKRGLRPTAESEGTSDASGPPSASDGVVAPGRLDRIRHLLFFPDDQVGWLPFAVFAALQAHRRTPLDAIYSTASPITAHLVAGILKRLTGLPWIAEFRDPWMGNALATRLPWFHRRLQVKLERWIVRSADRVVGLSPGITALYRARYPDAPEMVTITSGYDWSEVPAAGRPSSTTGTFRIVYTGTLDRPEELEIFLAGLAALAARRPDLTGDLEVSFYGFVTDACHAIIDRNSAGGLDGKLKLHGFVKRREALDALAQADAALILLGPGTGMGVFIGGKLFDYIGQNLQILAMLPPGDSRDILEGLHWGVTCDPDPGAVEAAVERLLTEPPPTGPADPEGRYDRFALAGRLAGSLDDVSSARPAPTARNLA